MGEERRGFKRLHSRFYSGYQADAANDRIQSITRNISVGGVCMATAEPLDVGTKLLVEVKFPIRMRPLVSFAEVSWTSKGNYPDVEGKSMNYECGLRFLDLADGEQRFIEHHVDLDVPFESLKSFVHD